MKRRYILILLFLAIAVYVATDKTRVCRPDGMSDAEAARIIAIATEHGESFRRAIGEMRSNGVSLGAADATLDAILADPDQAFALTLERYALRQDSFESRGITDTWMQYRLQQSDDLNEILRDEYYSYIHSSNTNYFSMKLTEYLRNLALTIGGNSTELPYRFLVNPDLYTFALAQFSKSAGLKNIFDAKDNKAQPVTINYRFVETWSIFRTDRLSFIRVAISGNPLEMELTIHEAWYNGFDITSGDLVFSRWLGNRNCLTTFTN
jgi:hypothetical protein